MNGLRCLKNVCGVSAGLGGVAGGFVGSTFSMHYLFQKGWEYGKKVEKKYSLIPYVAPIFFTLSGGVVGIFGGGTAGAIGGAAIGAVVPIVVPTHTVFKIASAAYHNFANGKES